MAQQLSIATASHAVTATGTLMIYVSEGEQPDGEAGRIWSLTGLDWAQVAQSGRFRGKQGQMLDLLAPQGLPSVTRLIVLGRGKPATGAKVASRTQWSDRGGSLMGKLIAQRTEQVSIILDEPDATPELAAELVAGMRLRHYKFDAYKAVRPGDEDKPAAALGVTLHVSDPAGCDAAIAERSASVAGTMLARDLVNEPPNVLGPVEFAGRAVALGALGLSVEVFGPEQLADLGMRSLLAVGQGSARPTQLVVMHWQGGPPERQPLAFIGKGVVFDSGGISIKPAAGMEDMKGDMGGAAAVTGLMQALATRKARVNAVGVVALVENMPDGNSMRPGDIVRAMSGTTIEIVNTDAEGRLALADALWYTQQRFKPELMIDLATLTGAIVVALGHDHAGLFSNNDELARRLLEAGLASGEKLWRLPLGAAYDKLIESRFADIKNSGGRPGGSISAAQFLQRFVNDVPWAHLDIAGTAMGGPASETNASWAPGFGVALLDRFVRDSYEL